MPIAFSLKVIPFLVCAALLDGNVDASSWCKERLFEPRLRALMQKVQVIHDKELDKMQPQATPCRMEIVLRNGEKVLGSVDHPKGHIRNPASDSDLENKFVSLNNSMLSPSQVSALIGLCWRRDEVGDVKELVSLMSLQGRLAWIPSTILVAC